MKAEIAESNVHMRMQDHKLDVIDRAARSLGVNRTQFMTGVSLDKATSVLLDQSLVQANSKAFSEILEWLDNPKSEEEQAGIKRLKVTKLPW